MKLKDYAILIGINAVITGLIVSFVISNQGRDKSALSSESTSKPEAPSVESMDDHHKPQPSNSSFLMD